MNNDKGEDIWAVIFAGPYPPRLGQICAIILTLPGQNLGRPLLRLTKTAKNAKNVLDSVRIQHTNGCGGGI